MTYKYGGTLLTHRNVMAPYLLHFEAMLRAKAQGCCWYDWYGISSKDDDRWAKFSAFKQKFGGQVWDFVPALDYVCDDNAYEAFRKRNKK